MGNSKKPRGRKTIASVKKAIEVIEYIAYSDGEVGVTEISKGLNYGVSATYHMLNTLRECNIIEQNERTKKFKLGLKLWQIGLLAYEQNHISIVLKPYLKKLRDLTGETANLTIMDNDQVVYIAQEESNRLVRMFTQTGATEPLHCTAAGKVLLAHKAKEIQELILNRIKLDKYTDKTIVDKKEFVAELNKIRKQGYGFDDEERELGVSCIGAPVFDLSDRAIACISISGPTARFTKENREKWLDIVLQVAEEATGYLRTID
ncbi:MAG TPA: IclR family transcriptional regulator [Tepidimicrobium sp.]|nr:IclR family transcriptional regulator [Tepidimicrobium sp.]